MVECLMLLTDIRVPVESRQSWIVVSWHCRCRKQSARFCRCWSCSSVQWR